MKIPDEKDVPENMRYYVYRYRKGENDYRCGAFLGSAPEMIYEIPHIPELPEDIQIEVYEVDRAEFIRVARDLEANSKDFVHKDFMTGEGNV